MFCVGLLFSFMLNPFTSTAQYRVVHLEQPYNTAGSETGALVVGDTVLVYSSLQPRHDRHNHHFSFDDQQTNIYQARIARSGKVARPRLSRWGINDKRDHTANLCLDPLTHDIYFTRARIDDPNLRCEMWWAPRQKRGWGKPQRLRGEVNLRDFTATQPTIGRLADSTLVLYFASDRPGGMGGMDIWYTLVKNGVAAEPVNLGPQVNSIADDITPYYDQPNHVLYFSSNRSGGHGGFDIYCAGGSRNTWQAAEPVCGCLNSEQNDIYFTITERDSATDMPLAGYLASNRTDSYFLTDSMCCNDIYRWQIDSSQWLVAEQPPADTLPTPDTTLSTPHSPLPKPPLPLFLYFHNDEPDPTSKLTTTVTSYNECQLHYAQLRNEYVSHQTTAGDSALMQEFFDSCVVGNHQRVEELFDYMEEQLDEGHKVSLTISGYASPVFKNEYNLALSERRIASFINMLRTWRGGLFANAMDDGHLTIIKSPHGAVEPTTESQSADPVYGLPATLARRIEIFSCEVK